MFAFGPFPRAEIPIGGEFDGFVSIWDILQCWPLVEMRGSLDCISFGIGHALDNELTFDLEEYVIGCQWTHWFLREVDARSRRYGDPGD